MKRRLSSLSPNYYIKMKSLITVGNSLIFGIIIGILLGIFSALSFLRTNWLLFKPDFFLWASIVLVVINIILVFVTQQQINNSSSEKKTTDARIKIWAEDSKGLITALSKIQKSKFTADSDIICAIAIIELSANSLFQSLNKAKEGDSVSDATTRFADAMENKAFDTVKEFSPSQPGNKVSNSSFGKQLKGEALAKSSQSVKATNE